MYYGPYTTIEGVVKNYKAFRATSAAGGQFEVNGIQFGYIDVFAVVPQGRRKWRADP